MAEEKPLSGTDPMDGSSRLSKGYLQEMKEGAEDYIDEFMRESGVKDPGALTDAEGHRRLKFGSAEVTAFIAEKQGDLYLYTDAVVMELPADKELILPLMRELLEVNVAISGSFRFGVRGDKIVASFTDSLQVLEPKDIGRHIRALVSFADAMDDQLTAKYAGTTRERPDRR